MAGRFGATSVHSRTTCRAHGKPGVVLVGVRDDGSCASLAIDDELLKRLANIHGEGDIQPLPSLTVQKRVLRRCAVAVVTVQPSSDPPGTVPRTRLGAGWAYRSRSVRGGRTTAPVRVHWFADRVEITSPGGLYGRITSENFGSGDTDYRNPLLAEIMHHLGFAQRFGLGVPIAREASGSERQSGARVPLRAHAGRGHGEGGPVTSIAVFNNKGGVGKTSLVYHLAWMYANLDYDVVVADLDPQANLTSMFLEDEELEELWTDDRADGTIYSALRPLLEGTGDVKKPAVARPELGVVLVPGDILLSGAEDELGSSWPDCLDRKPQAFRLLSAIWQVLQMAAEDAAADLVLLDVGPNIGALNRAALVAADHVVVPLAPDLHSLQGLRNLGPTLNRWRREWSERRDRNPLPDLDLPGGDMRPIGYVVLPHAVRLDRPFMAYERWMDRIPRAYRDSVVGDSEDPCPRMEEDPLCLATLKHFRSLMPLAQEARKPMFALKPADGAIGGHVSAVRGCYRDFRALAREVARRCAVPTPVP